MAHWYDKDGTPRHFEGKNGNPTTLREARKAAKSGDVWYPSVTTILNVIAKPALTNWLQEQAALTVAEQGTPANADIAWAREIVKITRDRTMAKADEGTAIHDALEQSFLGFSVAPEYHAMCVKVHDLLDEHCGPQEWIAEESFCDTHLGYAGKCDLRSANGQWVVDFKSKDDVDSKTKGWPDQAEQMAAYANGFGNPGARLANVFISRDDTTNVAFYEHDDEYAWPRFRAALLRWQTQNKYGPLFDALVQEMKQRRAA